MPAATALTPTLGNITLAGFIDKYLERCEPPVSSNDRGCLHQFSAFVVDERTLGSTAIRSLTEDTVEVFLAALRKTGRAASTRNKFVQAVKTALRWATKKGYLDRNPIGDADGLKREKHAKRDRRLVPDVVNADGAILAEGEERRLLGGRRAVASAPHHRRDRDVLPTWRIARACSGATSISRSVSWSCAPKRRAREDRRRPAVADLGAARGGARHGADGNGDAASEWVGPGGERDVAALLARCYVFGDDAGLQVGNFKRSWETAVLKAHGYVPQWTKTNKALTAASRAALEAIDLNFHDLRHEGGSRLLEAGWPLHHIQHMLGHANISQTSTYLNATRLGLHESMRRFDQSALRCNTVAIKRRRDHSAFVQRRPRQYRGTACELRSWWWWARVESNHRPLACEANALPLSHAPDEVLEARTRRQVRLERSV